MDNTINMNINKSFIYLFSEPKHFSSDGFTSTGIYRYINKQEWELIVDSDDSAPEISNRVALALRFIYSQYQKIDTDQFNISFIRIFLNRILKSNDDNEKELDFNHRMGLLVALIKIYMQIVWTGPLFRNEK